MYKSTQTKKARKSIKNKGVTTKKARKRKENVQKLLLTTI